MPHGEPPTRIDISVLGPLRLLCDGEPLAIRGSQRRALLALLTVDSARALGADELSERLGLAGRGRYRFAGLYALVSRLRRDLGAADGLVRSVPGGYRLADDRASLDLHRFEALLTGSRPEQPTARLARLDRALDLWRGEPWPELPEDLAARAYAEALRQRWSAAHRARITALIELGRCDDAVAAIAGRRPVEPDDEELVALHCRALYQLGRQRDALGVLRAYRDQLAQQTGLTTSAALEELEGALLRHALPPLGPLPTPLAALRTRRADRHRSPRWAGVLRGREHELDELGALVRAELLVSLVGPAGCGKTRLALEVVDGPGRIDLPVAFVDLAQTDDPAAVATVTAAALGVEVGDRRSVGEALVEYLTVVPHLLVLDNCEHVSAGVRSLVSQLVDRVPGGRILATSRAPLQLPSEHVLRLAPLVCEGGRSPLDSPAAQVFLDTARRVGARLELDSSGQARVASLCRALDGLPLALELAAGQLVVFGLPDLAARLDRRLDLLRGGPAGDDAGAARHETLRAAVAWSFELLDEGARRLFCQLAVMPAGAALDAIEWWANGIDPPPDVHAHLARLVEASMVVRVEAEDASRYSLLETMRAFALDELDRHDARHDADDRFVRWTLHLLRLQERRLLSEEEPLWNRRVRDELPNIRATRVLLRRDPARLPELVELSTLLDEWARVRDLDELWMWAEELVDLTRGSPTLHARALAMAAQGAFRRRGFVDARRLAEAALTVAQDAWARPRALTNLGAAHLFAGRFGDAVDALSARVAIDGDACDRAVIAFALAYDGDLEGARAAAEQALAAARTSGSPNCLAWAEYACGEIEAVAGSGHHEAHLRRAVELGRRAGAPITSGVALVTLTAAAARSGRVAEACAGYLELLEHWLRTGGLIMLWTTMRNVAELLRPLDPGTALMVWELVGDDPYAAGLSGPAARAEAAAIRQAERQLGPERTAAARAQARQLDRSSLVERLRTSLQRVRSAEPAAVPPGSAFRISPRARGRG